jgi:hypothetical protein
MNSRDFISLALGFVLGYYVVGHYGSAGRAA